MATKFVTPGPGGHTPSRILGAPAIDCPDGEWIELPADQADILISHGWLDVPAAFPFMADQRYAPAGGGGGGGDIAEAPLDGNLYGRQNAAWLQAYPAANPAGYQTAGQVTASLSAYLPLQGGQLSGALGVAAPGVNFPGMGASNASYQFAWSSSRIYPYVNGVAQGALAYLTDITVASVAGRTGAVILTHTDITDWTASLAPYALTTAIPLGSATLPVMDGAAAIGVGLSWARADHIHPTDTSRYDAANSAGYQTLAQLNAAVTRINVVPTAPCCSMTASATQSASNGVPLKINFDTAEFDVTSAFDVVNHRFNPKVAGYYQVNSGAGLAGNVNTLYSAIYKNGIEYRRGETGSNTSNARLSIIAHLNGTTDYLEGYIAAGAATTTSTTTTLTAFSAALVQASAN